METLTPMQKQYMDIKEKHKDAILLFRLGDFYEAFDEDAKIISDVLDITLTGRGKGDTRIPMAGIPYHALDNYLYKLVQAGYKIAIAEQLTEAGAGKMVERGVTKIVTSGTFTDTKNLKADQNNFIAAIHSPLTMSATNGKPHTENSLQKNKLKEIDKASFFLAYLDVTTGEFNIQEFANFKELYNEISRLSPTEILISEKFKTLDLGLKNFRKEFVYESDFDLNRAYEHLTRHFKVPNLKGYGLDAGDLSIIAAGVLLSYVKDNQKTELEHINSLKKVENLKYMKLDPATITNLELISNIRADSSNNLFKILNHCSTALGMRLLRTWLLMPLINKSEIESRLDCVEYLNSNQQLTANLEERLCEVMDIERLISRIGTGNINGRDLIGLKNSLVSISEVSKILNNSDISGDLLKIAKTIALDNYSFVIELIEKSINEECPVVFDHGGVIRQGYNKEIDDLKKLRDEGSFFIEQLQEKERKKSGISNLKIRFNRVFGYYIEISKANASKVPLDYVRKQTLVNAERFITPELKEFEDKVLTAEEKLIQLEMKQFEEIINQLREYIQLIQSVARHVAIIDVYVNFALLAQERKYTRPEFVEACELKIIDGRHPVVELIKKENFIANDLDLSDKNGTIVILTGPNMSGKSTYIRQIALIALMAQVGCFVPARQAKLKVFDRIYTRVGASDNLAAGESTFMVEMNETANILNNATKDSLIILDEVGRGTSTYDGVAIAWSIVEYIHQKLSSMTLFATHYHELIKLEEKFKSIKNYHVDVLDNLSGDSNGGKNIVFNHKIKKGGMDKSYGVHVAEMAGVPKAVIVRANEILKTLELKTKQTQKSINKASKSSSQKQNLDILQISLF
jgi:DNA mismatch repair protein MutS